MIDIISTFALIGSAISANKFILYSLPATLFVAIRMIIAGPTILIFNLIKKQNISIVNLKNNFCKILLAALCTSYIPVILKALALQSLPSGQFALIGSIDPIVTAVYSKILLKQNLSKKNVLGLILVTISLILSSGINYNLTFNYAHLIAILSLIVNRFGWILIQKLVKETTITPEQISGITMTIGGILSLITATIFTNFNSITVYQPIKFYILLIYTILMGNIIGLTLYAHLLKKYSATFLSLASFLVPLFVQTLGWLFLNEQLTINFIISLIFSFLGIYIFNLK